MPAGRARAAILGFIVFAVMVFLSYSAGFKGGWQFDDALNLGGLAEVKDVESAISFIFGGMSSDIGRPLALASFLLNVQDWPCCTAGFRQVNTLIHLFNGLLVFVLVRRVAILLESVQGTSSTTPSAQGAPPDWFAATLAGFWLAHPLLVSSNMMAVQRMTTLSATFVLLGLLGYLFGRQRLASGRIGPGYAWMSLSLISGALLGVLAKETAALLPFFAAAAEMTLLRPRVPLGNTPYWRVWQWLFLASPLALLLIYAVAHWSGIQHMAAYRPFDLAGRLASEVVILWEYLRQIVAPNVAIMGPYHDDAPVRSLSQLAVMLALVGWLAAWVVAWSVRKKWPLLTFALAWFAVGHLLESTIFPLELYFEHRNYLASLGPLAVMAGLIWSLPQKATRPVAVGALAVFLFLNYQAANVWGKPALAAAVWYSAHPASVRASKDLASKLAAAKKYDAALQVLESTRKSQPMDGNLNLDILMVQCLADDKTAADRQLAYLQANAERLEPGNGMLATLHNVVRLNRQGRCGSFDDVALLGLADALTYNPRLAANNRLLHVLHIVMSDIYRQRRDLGMTVQHLQSAYEAWPQVEIAQMYIFDLISAGLHDEARGQIARIRAQAPNNMWERKSWLRKLDELETMIPQ